MKITGWNIFWSLFVIEMITISMTIGFSLKQWGGAILVPLTISGVASLVYNCHNDGADTVFTIGRKAQ